ncbi:hypothetical protein O181_007235 [Austropuccinia psidii MF-1]|uniref:Uncharacterized protein n=1 Tax=Austropuccinia psidii MF-1 TaxID=1389203 RepID=A0A9Q3BMJ1_9BASI|nr:hypothetical protein [Austropuccinia psidii MF-1]
MDWHPDAETAQVPGKRKEDFEGNEDCTVRSSGKMTKRSPKKPTRSQATSSNDPHPQQPAQGISGRLFGLLKKFPMPISSPTKENSPLSEHFTQSSQSEHHPDAEDEEVEDDNDDDEMRMMRMMMMMMRMIVTMWRMRNT